MRSKVKSSLLISLLLAVFISFSPSVNSYVGPDSQGSAISQEEEFIRQGKEYYAKGDLLKAKAMFELALKENPNNKLAKSYLIKIDSALASDTMLAKAPNIEDLYSQGKQAFIEGDYEKAVKLFEEVLSYVPNHQYAKMYLERARAHISRAPSQEEEIVRDYASAGDISDPTVLKTKLKVALLSLQEQLLGYFQTLSELKEQQEELIKKYLEEKERRVKELEERVKDQSELLDRLSSERLKLQTELARINQEILLLERRLSSEFYRRTGRGLSWEDIEQLDELESELSAEEKRLRERLKQELELRRQLELELRKIEEKLKGQGQVQAQLSEEVKEVGERGFLPPAQEKKAEKISRKELKRLYREGKRAFKQGDYDTAIEKLSRLIELAPEDRLSKAARKLLEKAEAKRRELQLAQKILAEKTEKKLNLFAQAQDAYFNGDFDEAIALCEKVLAIDPEYGPAKELRKLARLSKEEKIREKEKKEKKTELVEKSEPARKELPPEVEVPDYQDEVKEKLAAIKEQAERRREEYISQRLAEIKELIKAGDLDKAEELLLRLVRLYPDEKTPIQLLEEVRGAKREQAFAKALEEVNDLIEKKEYVLAEEKLNSLIRRYPEKRSELLALKKELEGLLVQPYLDQIESLAAKDDVDSLREALRLISKAKAKFPKVVRLSELEKDIRARLRELEEENRRIARARARTLEALKEEVAARCRKFRPDDSILRRVDEAQESYREEFYETTLEMAERCLKVGDWEKAKDLIALLETAPERYQRRAERLAEEIREKELEREFEKHIELARSALKVYDFSTARAEIEKARVICPRCKKRVERVLNELEERIKFYKVQQALKTAQVYLQNGDFVSAKIVVKDILKNVDPKNRYAKEMLKQIEKAESLYYADVKLRQGVMALKAGDYESAVRLAKEGLKLDSKSKDLWDLYRRAKSRWRSEILRRKSLLRQIEEEAAQKRRVRLAAQQVDHKELEFTQKVGLLESDVQGLLNQARRLMEEQKFDRAISLCEKVLEYYPDNVEARTLLDLILLTQEEVEKKKRTPEEKVSERQINEIEKFKIAKVKRSKALKEKEVREREKPKPDKGEIAKESLSKEDIQASGREQPAKVVSKAEGGQGLKRDERLMAAVDQEISQRVRLLGQGMVRLNKAYQKELERKANQQLREELKQMLAKVKKRLERADISGAEEIVSQMKELAPRGNREVKLALRELERKKKEISLARKRLERAVTQEVGSKAEQLAKERERLERAYRQELDRLARQQLEKELSVLLAQVEEKIQSRDFVGAESLLTKARSLAPANPKVEEAARMLSKEKERIELARARLEKALEEELKEKAGRLTNGQNKLERSLDRELERLAQNQLEEEVSARLAQARSKLRAKEFKAAKELVDEALEIWPNNSKALALRKRIKRLHQQELERIAREQEARERRYQAARERMFEKMKREILARGEEASRQWEQLSKEIDKERWLLAKVQREKEIEERLERLEVLLTEAMDEWEKTDLVAKEISELQKMEGFTPAQRKHLRSLAKEFTRLMARIEEEKARTREEVGKRLAALRLAQGESQKDVPNKDALVRDMISKAREALIKGDYKKVLEVSEDILDISPDNKEAISLAQKAKDMLKREAELKEKQASIQEERYPKLREIYEKAKEAYDQGNYVKARELFRKVYQEEKKLGMSYYSPYAREYLDLIKEREKDIKALNREKETEELKAKIVEKLYEDAKRFERQGKYSAAASVYENILFLFPNDQRAREKLFKVKEKMFALEKEELQRKLDEQDKEMLKQVMKDGLVSTQLKKKKVDLEQRRKKRLINLPPIKKKLQQRITANFEDVPLVDVLRFFAKQTGINIIPSASVLAQDYKVTIDITDMPLESALKYLLKSYNLTYQIDEDAVWITTPDQLEKEPMETKVYHLNKGIGLYSKFTLTTTGSVDLGSGASVSEVRTLKDILQEAVDWPSGSKLVLDERTGALIVTNTPANIKKIDEILWNLDVTPVQVLIEAKFLEVDITDLKEIGVEWKIANEDWAVDSVNSEMKHGVAKDSGFSFPDFANASSGLNLTYKGVLTKPQFQAVLHALMQSQNTRTLSSPRVTTLNNQTATIKVVDEWIYPTRYEFQIVQFDLNGDGDYDDAGETRYENVPTDFVKRDVGIILRVTPSVGDDLKTISLSLLPEVSDATKNYFEYTGGVSLPKFTSRTLSTNVVVENTDTVVLGGLIKENRTKVLTKVPILGDIPLLGQMFRKTSDEVNRRNLLIFVTATIIDPEGDALVSE